MQITTIVEREKVKLHNGVLITGLPGIGMIGNIVGRHLVESLKTQKIANLYSPHFPHQVFMGKHGGLRLIKNRFYRARGKPVVVLLGDVQAISSTGQYEVADVIIQYAKKIGIKTIITIGGYSTGKISEERQIFGAATHKSLVQKLKKHNVVFGKARGSIVGAAGLLPALGRLRGLEGACIMGETHGGYVDATAAKNIVMLLSRYLGIPIDIKKLEQKAKESEKILKKIEEEIQKNVMIPYEPTKRPVSYIR
ncbi:MAG TPA: proteasome assembly chaperone family protein [Candidatus Bilamarchaeaceae archaeon]|nr:proteasome assembly chaperone family protein [Candidatus Bilamarchaeaceae archaeon]